ncbi:MAG: heat-inducible transcriptional repressor HrcA [Gammaproteobacteria bacterium]|nr:heat-inducible transcriptional repressor HrcA [Gammaproteobacteria bacterium]
MTSERASEAALNERALHLFKVLVEVYIREGHPVGSRTLARTAGLDLSPATVRNVMADLEELGLLVSPHTSAGRVPTTQGFRLFVDNMVRVKPLQITVLDQLKEGLDPGMNHKNLMETASGLLSGITQMAGIITVPRKQNSALRQIEFLELSQNRILAILVVNEQEVQNRIIHLDRAYTKSELQEAANYLNSQFAGKDLRQVRFSLLKELDRVRQDMDQLMRSAIELGEKVFVDAEDNNEDEDFIVVGRTYLMDYEQLSDVEQLRKLFDAFKHKREMLHLLDKCICAEGVQIFFGQESDYQPLSECSVVSAPYSVEDEVVGVLGIIGPTRMAYDRVIPIVDVTAKLLSAALNPRT